MEIREHLNAIEERGFAILEAQISERHIARIRNELSPYLAGQHFGRNDFEGFRSERVYALLAKAPSIAALIEHPAVMALTDMLLPKNYLLSAALAINVHPGETPQDWHIDDASGSGGHPAFARPRKPYGISAIWALDDFVQDNGATELVPGSHRWTADREPEAGEIVQALMPAGSVLVFAGNLLHRGGANQSSSTRLAITPQYCMPWMRQIENMPLAAPPQIARGYSERIQELLGYSIVEPGFTGYVDGRHPKHLINSDYRGNKYQ